MSKEEEGNGRTAGMWKDGDDRLRERLELFFNKWHMLTLKQKEQIIAQTGLMKVCIEG